MSNSNFHFKRAISNVFITRFFKVFVFEFVNDRISVKNRHKRKHDDRTLEIKYNKSLVEFEKGRKTNKDIAKLFDIPPSTLSYAEVKAISIVESYNVFTTFDLRKGLCGDDATPIVERVLI